MYLVVISHAMDDLPLAIFESKESARLYANSISWEAGNWVKSILSIDADTPQVISIFEFTNQGGAGDLAFYRTASREIVRDYEKEM